MERCERDILDGIDRLCPEGPLGVAVSGGGQVYAGTAKGVFVLDGGSWRALTQGLSDTRVCDLAFDPSNPRVIYAACDGPGGSLLRSADCGEVWVEGPVETAEAR